MPGCNRYHEIKNDILYKKKNNNGHSIFHDTEVGAWMTSNSARTILINRLYYSRDVVRGGQRGIRPHFKYYWNAVFSVLLSNEKLHFETNSRLIIPCLKNRELYGVTKLLVSRKSKKKKKDVSLTLNLKFDWKAALVDFHPIMFFSMGKNYFLFSEHWCRATFFQN